MLAINRWRKWQPKKFEITPESEPSKPTEPTFEGFEGSTLGQMQNFSDRPPDREGFKRWAVERCAGSPERSERVGSLLVDFAEWCAGHHGVPCQRVAFERLMQEAGFRLRDGEAAGLLLKAE